MKNILILGSGRSGTSMVAGCLAQAGYFMGDRLYKPRESNPKGFFEDSEVNGINEALIAKVTPNRPWLLGRWFFQDRTTEGQRWLARVSLGTEFPVSQRIAKRIQPLTQKTPYCYKDPRFSYTLNVWRPFLEDTVFICVFRDPASTALSMLKEVRDSAKLQGFLIDFEGGLEVWQLMYRHILEIHRHQGDWLFIHYNQVLTEMGLDRIEQFVEASVDRSFPDPNLRRTVSERPVPPATWKIYAALCELAGYDEE